MPLFWQIVVFVVALMCGFVLGMRVADRAAGHILETMVEKGTLFYYCEATGRWVGNRAALRRELARLMKGKDKE